MSQINRNPDIRPTRVNADVRQPIGSLQVQRQPFQPPDFSGVTQGRQLLDIARGTAQVANSAIRYSVEAQNIADGEAVTKAEEFLATVPDSIADQDQAWALEMDAAGGVEAQAQTWLNQQTDGMDDRQKQAFRKRATVPLLGMLTQRRNNLSRIAARDNTHDIEQSMKIAQTPEELTDLVQDIQAKDPNATELGAYRSVLRFAQEAASNNDPQSVRMAMEALGDRFSGEQLGVMASLQNAQDRAANEELFSQARLVEAAIASGEPADFIEQDIQVIEQGSLDDNRGTALGAELRGKLKQRGEGQTRSQQAEHYNNTARSIGLRRWRSDAQGNPSIDATVNQVIDSMDLPNDEPRFIDANRGLALIQSIGNTRVNDERQRHVRQRIAQRLQGGSGAPLSADYDTAITANLINKTYINGTFDGRQPLVESITRPDLLRLDLDAVGRVPRPISQLVAGGMAGDPPQVAEASLTLAYLHLQNPVLSDQVIDQMNPAARVRARYVTSRIELNRPATENLDQMTAETARLAEQAMAINPVELTADQLKGLAWFGSTETPRHDLDDDRVLQSSREGVRDALENSGLDARGFFSDAFVPTQAANAYAALYEEELGFALATTHHEDAAVKQAKKVAARRLMNVTPPIDWHGSVVLQAPGSPRVGPGFQDAVEQDIRDSIKFFDDQSADEFIEELSDHTPVWDGGRRGWIFLDRNGSAFTHQPQGTIGASVLVVDPRASQIVMSAQEQARQWEQRARERRSRNRIVDPSTFQGSIEGAVLNSPS